MRTLVTGGAGFVGSHVVEALVARGDDVLVLDDLSTGRWENLAAVSSSERLVTVTADLLSPDAADAVRAFGPEGMVLLAAQASVARSMGDPLGDARTNVLGLVAMLELACATPVRKVVFAASGGTAYGDVPVAAQPITESQPRGHASSFYGLTKNIAIEYLRLYSESRGLASAALALGNVYGPRQDPHGESGVVAIFLERLRQGVPCVIHGDGETTRDFVHVDDVSRAFCAALQSGDGLFNVGTGRELSVNEVHAALARHFPDAPSPQHDDALPGEVRRVALDSTRAAEQLGWRAETSFDDGVATLVREGGR